MCNRYNLQDPPTALEFIQEALRVELRQMDGTIPPRFNVAPESKIPVVVKVAGLAEVRLMRWGLLPAEVRDRPGQKFYAKALAEKARVWSGFSKSVEKRRCLIPANGYYEWAKVGGVNHPHLFTLSTGAPFAFAGIWELGAGDLPETVAILTTKPNELAAMVHSRMPVVLTGNQVDRWLGDQPLTDPEFEALTAPAPAGLLTEREVHRFVSSSKHEGPQCIAPPDFAFIQVDLMSKLPAADLVNLVRDEMRRVREEGLREVRPDNVALKDRTKWYVEGALKALGALDSLPDADLLIDQLWAPL